MWNNFPGCNCLKHFLTVCGFDNEISLLAMNNEVIKRIELHINQNPHLTQGVECIHKESYLTGTNFTLLPGHSNFLLNLPEHLKSKLRITEINKDHASFSSVLSAMIEATTGNFNRAPKAHRYSKILLDFSIYVYLLGGKALYKFLGENLPLPKVPTISKF